MKNLIIIPTYNEAKNIERMIPELFTNIFASKDISILVVDDNSPDRTADIVRTMQDNYKALYLLKREKKDGLGSAYRDGFEWAINHDYDVIVQLDSDFQHPIEMLPKMLSKIPEYDVVIGSRYIDGGEWDYCKNKFTVQKFISEMGRIYLSKLLTCPIQDMTGGFNIWKKEVLKTISMNNVSSKGYAFQFEMKYFAYKRGFKILEFPIKFKKREFGKSKMNYKIILEALAMVCKLRNKN